LKDNKKFKFLIVFFYFKKLTSVVGLAMVVVSVAGSTMLQYFCAMSGGAQRGATCPQLPQRQCGSSSQSSHRGSEEIIVVEKNDNKQVALMAIIGDIFDKYLRSKAL
jgi:hypothetical protein